MDKKDGKNFGVVLLFISFVEAAADTNPHKKNETEGEFFGWFGVPLLYWSKVLWYVLFYPYMVCLHST